MKRKFTFIGKTKSQLAVITVHAETSEQALIAGALKFVAGGVTKATIKTFLGQTRGDELVEKASYFLQDAGVDAVLLNDQGQPVGQFAESQINVNVFALILDDDTMHQLEE